jgi:hypothetical protein
MTASISLRFAGGSKHTSELKLADLKHAAGCATVTESMIDVVEIFWLILATDKLLVAILVR